MGKKIFILALLSFVTLFFFLLRGSKARYSVDTYTEIVDYEQTGNPEKSDTFSILTYNIGFLSGLTNNEPIRPDYSFFESNLKECIRVIRQINPDLIGLQEIDFESKRTYLQNQLDSIGNQAGFYHGAKAVNWDKRYVPFPYWPPKVQYGRMFSGQAILSKFPIKSNERVVLDKPANNPFYYNAFYIDRLIQITMIDIRGTEVILMNIHLEAYDKKTRSLQAKDVMEYYRSFAQDYPVILMGDFNALPDYDSDEETIMELFNKEPGLRSVIDQDEYRSNPETFYTFSSEEPFQMIDYIFYNTKIKPLESRVVRDFGLVSDHFPLYFRFTLNHEQETE